MSQYGGHSGPCELNQEGTRCRLGKSWDHANCKLSAKGRCQKNKKKAVIKVKQVQKLPPVHKTEIPSKIVKVKGRASKSSVNKVAFPRMTFRLHDNILLDDASSVVVLIEKERLPTDDYEIFACSE